VVAITEVGMPFVVKVFPSIKFVLTFELISFLTPLTASGLRSTASLSLVPLMEFLFWDLELLISFVNFEAILRLVAPGSSSFIFED